MMSVKTICFFSGDITRSGGTECVAVMLANALARQGSYRIRIVSLTEQAANARPYFSLDPGIRHYALAKQWIQPGCGYIPIIPRLRRFLLKHHVDILIDIDTVLDVLSVPASWFTHVKVLSWEHFNYRFEISIKYRKWIIRHMTPRADLLITLTNDDKKQFLQAVKKKRKKHLPVCAIQNPIPDPAIYPGHSKSQGGNRSQNFPVPTSMDDMVQTSEKELWIITAGRLTYQKGMDYLVQAAELVLKKYPRWSWIVLGDGEQRDFLNAQIQDKGLKGRLILAGQAADVSSYLKKAQIFVLTSRWEGMPMCLLEAKAHGLACISFDIATGPREIIADHCNGFLVPAFNCKKMAGYIGKLIEDAALRQVFCENAKLDIEKFQMDTVLKKWEKVLKIK